MQGNSHLIILILTTISHWQYKKPFSPINKETLTRKTILPLPELMGIFQWLFFPCRQASLVQNFLFDISSKSPALWG